MIDVAEATLTGGVLVGGQMVLLHALEHNVQWPRVSTDLDVIVNACVGSAMRNFVGLLEDLGFLLDGMSPELLAHRYRRGAASIDMLAPEGLGIRADLTTTPPGHTLQVPGGKSCAVDVDDAPVNQEPDLALLLSLVRDPFALRDDLTAKDRQRLRHRKPMTAPKHRVRRSFETVEANNARTALAVLLG